MNEKQQIREDFKIAVFKRDHSQCVMCGKPAVDAHHITDRTEMPNGGYVKENGISLCEICHKLAEKYHITNGKEWVAGYHPSELYMKIHSSYEKAYEASMKILKNIL